MPPLPPHITLEKAKAFSASILAGDPDRAGYVARAVSQMFPGVTCKVERRNH